MKLTTERILDWIVPILLAGAIHAICQVSEEISDTRHETIGLDRRLREIESKLNAPSERFERRRVGRAPGDPEPSDDGSP